MVIITGPPGHRDDEAPPRSIFDPPHISEEEELSDEDGWGNTTIASSHADTLTTRDTLSTGISGSPSHGRRHHQHRHHRKHPSQLNEVELRIQLWDSYRLARIILGTPIKSSSLRGKTILHSIRKVAEMKLELIRLEKQLEMSQVIRDSQREEKMQQHMRSSSDATIKASPSNNNNRNNNRNNNNNNLNTSLSDELNFQIANILVPEDTAQQSPARATTAADDTPMQSNRRERRRRSQDDDHGDFDFYDNNDDNNENDEETPPQENKTFSLEQRLDMYKVRYETLQTTHDEMMQEFQTQLLEMQSQLLMAAAVETASSSPAGKLEENKEAENAPQATIHSGDALVSTPTTHPATENAEEHTPDRSTSRVVTPIATAITTTAPTGSPSEKSRSHPWDPVESPLSKARREAAAAEAAAKASSSLKNKKSPPIISRAEDTLNAVAAVARDHDVAEQTPEELHLRTVLAKKSNAVRPRKTTSNDNNSTTEPINENGPYSQERQRLQQMVEQLMKRVEESSEATKAQFDSLQEKLRSYQEKEAPSGNGDASSVPDASSIPDFLTTCVGATNGAGGGPSIQNQQQFQRRMKTAKTLHTLELETAKSKHVQQVVDLSGQLDSYQQQVEKQNSELQRWRRKYRHLEEMAVTPNEAKDVLRELEGLSPLATREELERVHAKVVRVLQRMVHLQIRQQEEQQIMDQTRELAQARVAVTQEELEDLKLQLEILEEDTKVPPEEWQKQIGQQRRTFETEIKDLFRKEEKRMIEIENLEVRLTELAFVAVDIEDLERECDENHQLYAEELSKARRDLASTTPIVQQLQSQMKKVLARQRKTLQDLELAWSKGIVIDKWQGRLAELCHAGSKEETKIPNDEQLQQRDEELRQTQQQLIESQRRVQELEAEMEKLRSDGTVSTAQLSSESPVSTTQFSVN